VEVPVRIPHCSGFGVGAVLELEDAAAMVTMFGHRALLELRASLLYGF